MTTATRLMTADELLTMPDDGQHYEGCRLGWLIDPSREAAVIYHPPGVAVRTLGLDDVLDGEDVVPGFTCRLRDALHYWPD